MDLKPPTSNTTSTSSSKRYPALSPPNDNWTIEQLLFWSLDQYHSAAISKTNSHLDALRLQCENECDDVLMLHELAVQMRGEERGEELKDGAAGIAEENVDPQQQQEQQQSVVETEEGQNVHQLKQPPPAATAATTTSSNKPKSSTNKNTTTTTVLVITILSGPHASQTYKLQPKHTQPCLIGRSKGKKFLRNGISLSKDQEVSTTHGKFSVEEVVLDHTEDDDDGNTDNTNSRGGGGGVQKKFYYTDVGSTNGSSVGFEERLEANVKVEIEEGMELTVGHSTLKIAFG
eukprot:CAMPEP_0201716314 /NCGR_PEP_ID=MMETSP0593-20130828/2326_1 /ASSEMBLY_ACC=CAM_ASM_000672 /TAXON_ID=267983 /ORGANISM="Skeletonema japonicum, Strain CCMP2506" /LENGTH=288 /DNA_ID=CAMNT_0048206101 /DNA_START=190 /DNA_END=1056 /DNA_ORIENTATION=+